jgi:hypothetical protein
MFVRLKHNVQHLSCILTRFIDQPLSDFQESGESRVNYLLELDSLVRLVSIDAADRKKTLEPGEDRGRIIGAEKLYRDVYKGWPLVRKVGVEDLLEYRHELLANLGRGGRKEGQQPFTKPLLLILRYGLVLGSILARRPTS